MAFGNFEFPHSNYYDSDLRELLRILGEYKEQVERLSADFKELDAGFTVLTNRVGELGNKVADLYNYVDQQIYDKFIEYRQEIAVIIDSMRAQIAFIESQVAGLLEAAQAYADAKDTLLKLDFEKTLQALTDELFEELFELRQRLDNLRLEVTNPLTGFSTSVGTAVSIVDIYHREKALTNNEYSDLGLTNDDYARQHIWNVQYWISGKILQNKKLHKIHPVTGEYTSDYNIHSYLATMIFDTLNVDDYISRDLTNDEYAAFELTNQDYFFTKAETQWVIPT